MAGDEITVDEMTADKMFVHKLTRLDDCKQGDFR
jgi:hypothetical protein